MPWPASVGGHSHHRHDACRDVLGRHLKPLVTSVKFEQFVHELAQPDEDTGETRAARLDLVVLTKDRKRCWTFDFSIR